MMRWLAIALLVLACGAARAQAPATDEGAALREMPTALGFPISVRASVMYLDVIEVDENAGHFDATIDVRLRWRDPRLAFDRSAAPRGFLEYWGDAAAERLAQIWQPSVEIGNLTEAPTF